MKKYKTLHDTLNELSPERRERIEARVQTTLTSLHLSELRKTQAISQEGLAN